MPLVDCTLRIRGRYTYLRGMHRACESSPLHKETLHRPHASSERRVDAHVYSPAESLPSAAKRRPRVRAPSTACPAADTVLPSQRQRTTHTAAMSLPRESNESADVRSNGGGHMLAHAWSLSTSSCGFAAAVAARPHLVEKGGTNVDGKQRGRWVEPVERHRVKPCGGRAISAGSCRVRVLHHEDD